MSVNQDPAIRRLLDALVVALGARDDGMAAQVLSQFMREASGRPELQAAGTTARRLLVGFAREAEQRLMTGGDADGMLQTFASAQSQNPLVVEAASRLLDALKLSLTTLNLPATPHFPSSQPPAGPGYSSSQPPAGPGYSSSQPPAGPGYSAASGYPAAPALPPLPAASGYPATPGYPASPLPFAGNTAYPGEAPPPGAASYPGMGQLPAQYPSGPPPAPTASEYPTAEHYVGAPPGGPPSGVPSELPTAAYSTLPTTVSPPLSDVPTEDALTAGLTVDGVSSGAVRVPFGERPTAHAPAVPPAPAQPADPWQAGGPAAPRPPGGPAAPPIGNGPSAPSPAAGAGGPVPPWLAEVETLLANGDNHAAIGELQQYLPSNVGEARAYDALLRMLQASPNLATVVRNLLEELKDLGYQLPPAGDRALQQAMAVEQAIANGAAPPPFQGPVNGAGNNGPAAGPGGFGGQGGGFGGQGGGFGGPGAGFGGPPGGGGGSPGVSGAVAGAPLQGTSGHWQQALELLNQGNILLAAQFLQLVPPDDPHYPIAQDYLKAYDPSNPELQQLNMDLARLIVVQVTTLLNRGQRDDVKELVARMDRARQLIDAYNRRHLNRQVGYPPSIDTIDQQAQSMLDGWDAFDAAGRALLAGRPEEAQAQFAIFERLLPLKAILQDEMKRQIEAQLAAMHWARRFYTSRAQVEPRGPDDVTAAEAGVAALNQVLYQRPYPDPVPPPELERLQVLHDHLDIGAKLLKVKGEAAKIQVRLAAEPIQASDAATIYTDLIDAIQSLWSAACDPNAVPWTVRIRLEAVAYVVNRLVSEASFLMDQADQPKVTPTQRSALLRAARRLSQEARTRVRQARSAFLTDPASAAMMQGLNELVDDCDGRLGAAQRKAAAAGAWRQFGAPLTTIAIAGMVLFVAFQLSRPFQDWVLDMPDRVFPPPTATPVPPTATPVPPTATPVPVVQAARPDPGVASGQCHFLAVFNVCDRPDGPQDSGLRIAFKRRFDEIKELVTQKAGPDLVGNPVREWDEARRTQFFEYARMEYHGQMQNPRDQVLFGLIGAEVLNLPEYEPVRREFGNPVAPDPNKGLFIQETGHHVAPEFRALYDLYDRHERLGYPLTEPYRLNNNTLQVQWFQRVRMEVEVDPTGRPGTVRLAKLGCEHLEKIQYLRPHEQTCR